MSKIAMKIFLLVTIGSLALTPGAWADQWNQKTTITFSGPVEIPGQVLPAGTYVFKLADSSANRQIVQVFNKEENHVYGTFLTIPDYRLRPTEQTLIRFHERPAGQPEAIKAWFYPGRNYGHEFVYPKKEAVMLAKVNFTPVPAMPTELEPMAAKADAKFDGPEITAMILAPLVAERPDGSELRLAEVFMISPDQDPDAEEIDEELPATASRLPLIAVAGAIAVLTGLIVRLAKSH